MTGQDAVQRGPGVRRGRVLRRRRDDQARRRRARRRRPLREGGHRQADPVRLHRRGSWTSSSASTRTGWRSGSSAWATSSTFIEKARSRSTQRGRRDGAQSCGRADFSLDDFLSQMKQVRRMGPADQPARHAPRHGGREGAARASRSTSASSTGSRAIILFDDPGGAPPPGADQGPRAGCGSPVARAPTCRRSTNSSSSSTRCGS